MNIKKRIHQITSSNYAFGIAIILAGIITSISALWFGRNSTSDWMTLGFIIAAAPIGLGTGLVILERRSRRRP